VKQNIKYDKIVLEVLIMNMFDYLKWRGDLTFKQDEFNEIDNLILSYVCYVDFNGIVDDSGSTITFEKACEKFYQLHTMDEVLANKSLIAKSPLVFLEASKTNRFKDLLLHNYVDILEEEKARQFSAIQFDLDKHTTFLAIRGTDDTMIGWQEDLLLSYKIIDAQVDTVNYINSHFSRFKKYYIGGHSKGGNLAVYGGACCNESCKKRIIRVFNNDGPCLSSRFVDEQKINDVMALTKRIIPGFSVFGMIYADHPYTTEVVKSTGKLLFQHDPVTWQIEGKNFIELPEVSNESIMIKQSLDEFINDTTDEEKEVFVNELFKSIKEANITKVSDIAIEGAGGLIKIIKEASDINETAKNVGNKLINVLKQFSYGEVNMIKESTSDYIKDKVNDVQAFINDRVTDVEGYIDEKKANIKGIITKQKSTE